MTEGSSFGHAKLYSPRNEHRKKRKGSRVVRRRSLLLGSIHQTNAGGPEHRKEDNGKNSSCILADCKSMLSRLPRQVEMA